MNRWLSYLFTIFSLTCRVIAFEIDVSETPIYSKVGADVSLQFTVKNPPDGTVNGIKVTFLSANQGDGIFGDIAIITFNNKGEPIIENSKTDTQFKDRVEVNYDNLKITYTIKNLAKADFNRDFKCSADDGGFLNPQNIILLNEAVPPIIAASSLFDNANHEEVKLGSENKDYECSARGTPTPIVTWYEIGSDGSENVMSKGQGQASLIFEEVKLTDRGGYMCVAGNIGGSVNKTFFLIIGFLNFEEASPSTITKDLQIGDMLQANCPITGHPRIIYNWRKNGTEVFQTTRALIYTIKDNSDFRNFTCTASNKYGKLVFTVIVKMNPTKQVITDNQKGNSSSPMYQSSVMLLTLLHLVFYLVAL